MRQTLEEKMNEGPTTRSARRMGASLRAARWGRVDIRPSGHAAWQGAAAAAGHSALSGTPDIGRARGKTSQVVAAA
jgi:hypothetical protein